MLLKELMSFPKLKDEYWIMERAMQAFQAYTLTKREHVQGFWVLLARACRITSGSPFSALLDQKVRAHHQSDERSLPGSEKSNSGKEKAVVSSGSMSQEVGKTSSDCRRRLGPDKIASLKDLVSSCSRQGSVNLKQRMIGKEVGSKEEAGNKGEDDHKVSSTQNLGPNWNQVHPREKLLPLYKSPKQELD